MCINDTRKIESSKPEFWEKSYKSGEMGWDIGEPTPVFNSWIQTQKESLSICILGAGNGWDALHFAEKGHKVTAVDFAESAVLNMNVAAAKRGLKLNILHMDIFNSPILLILCWNILAFVPLILIKEMFILAL